VNQVLDTGAIRGSFAQRYFKERSLLGPLVMGIDPSRDILLQWGLEDSPGGLADFCKICLESAAGNVALVKFQSAFFERQGYRGLQVLSDSLKLARENGLLVILDGKRGDIGNTSLAYAETYFSQTSDFFSDATTVSPYLGLADLGPVFEMAHNAGGYVFVVARSSNPGARSIQAKMLDKNLSVEASVLAEIRRINESYLSDKTDNLFLQDHPGGTVHTADPVAVVGPVGAVVAPNCQEEISVQLASLRCLFLAPGIGAQGATMAQTADLFSGCIDNVLPSMSRSILASGPDIRAMVQKIAEIKSDMEQYF